jgi:predicted transposase YbfD/YdcC
MGKNKLTSFLKHFTELKDPRINRRKIYPLDEILLLVLCAVICGAESWGDFVIFGNEKFDFLKGYLPYKNGIPSRNTIERVFKLLNPEGFKECFINWVKSFQDSMQEVIAIDGKTLRHSFDNAKDKPAIHMVSAFATKAGIVLGQEKVNEKSNEITAIPELLKLLDVKGAIITIDAMGCQKKIAKAIIEKDADYVLSLKDNQGNLYDDVKDFFESEKKEGFRNNYFDYYEELNKGHGRIEHRKYWITDQIDWIDQKDKWKSFNTIGITESARTIKDKTTKETRFFIASLPKDAKLFGSSARSHWGIENSLHWILDMTFREDESRIRIGNAAENMAIIRHISLNMLKNAKKKDSSKEMSIKRLRKKAGWSNNALAQILLESFQ